MDFLDRLIDLALEEDLSAAGDITTSALVPKDAAGRAELWAKEPMVLSGCDAFSRVFQRFDPQVEVEFLAAEGEWIGKKACVAKLSGRLSSLLTAERTALNLIQRTSGISTMARRAVRAVGRSGLRILDTRKTSPGMRGLSKAAARAGGALNHRFGLFDGVLIKDNHIAAVGSVREAVRRAKARSPRLVKIEVEITKPEQLEDAIAEGADAVLLDNMNDAQIRRAVKIAAGRVELEISGRVTLDRLPQLAKLGAD
ncbi:MAG TPA: carboxylating nicotinate-nucleotide diphosphorylase, partial [Myxococcaceae bacterium]|nr:carboxylating nicotinate-nucleotide diphosphorylase [Myxococcaceae bacterium]